LSRCVSAVLLALALGAGNAAGCAGWMATPEARMACCSDEASCTMHQSHSETHDGGPKRAVSQAEADRCCAASEGDDSVPSASTVAFVVTLGLVIGPVVPASIPQAEAHGDLWRASVPIPAARVPKHLLLSVFLV
jgi:hypothetical protein